MLSPELAALTVTAASLGFFHTLLGPDHYLPFVVMARARRWSQARTAWITLFCGLGHIGSSVVLGLAGITLGMAVTSLEGIEALRGDLAAWALIACGLVYFAWGLKKAYRYRPHEHSHFHENGTAHTHRHIHGTDHAHVHGDNSRITPWVLFIIFVLGPCEPLLPVLMYPAAKESLAGMLWVTGVFGTVTILTMMGIVLFSLRGISLIPLKGIERYTHALAGGTICLCGIAIQYLGV
ncbi:MAG TPA: sulfite exporter TauE/SafE family protein [Syntrophales bacterium]|nr:sulfite exporter TauE/SafE family protein [Deltaproteobacteria bacterium]HOD98731.1 sulfite exporter TauE/SafE family protein [Syntrophales bacterium]HPN09012.1 sulfite exporter TauE/SafE family protein [Syntrophales bacterium]HQK78610.1 sulfite exporter TauE/SafE family protein [Syntrophales bacterium]